MLDKLECGFVPARQGGCELGKMQIGGQCLEATPLYYVIGSLSLLAAVLLLLARLNVRREAYDTSQWQSSSELTIQVMFVNDSDEWISGLVHISCTARTQLCCCAERRADLRRTANRAWERHLGDGGLIFSECFLSVGGAMVTKDFPQFFICTLLLCIDDFQSLCRPSLLVRKFAAILV